MSIRKCSIFVLSWALFWTVFLTLVYYSLKIVRNDVVAEKSKPWEVLPGRYEEIFTRDNTQGKILSFSVIHKDDTYCYLYVITGVEQPHQRVAYLAPITRYTEIIDPPLGNPGDLVEVHENGQQMTLKRIWPTGKNENH